MKRFEEQGIGVDFTSQTLFFPICRRKENDSCSWSEIARTKVTCVKLGPVCAHPPAGASRGTSGLPARPWAQPSALRTRPTWLFQQNNSLFLPPHLPSGAEKLLYWLFILNLFNPPWLFPSEGHHFAPFLICQLRDIWEREKVIYLRTWEIRG